MDYKAPTLGKLKLNPPRIYTCCEFILSSASSSSSSSSMKSKSGSDLGEDLIVGGSNGYVYLYRRGECVAYCAAVKGGVKCLTVHSSYIFVGGASPFLKVLDIRSLSQIISFDISSTLTSTIVNNNTPKITPKPLSNDSKPQSIRRTSSVSVISSPARPRSSSSSRYQRKDSLRSNDDSSIPSKDDTSNNSMSTSSRRNSVSSISQQPNSNITLIDTIEKDVSMTCISVVPGVGRVSLQSTYALITMSSGKFIKANIGAVLASIKASTVSSGDIVDLSARTLFYFSVSPVHGLAIDTGRQRESPSDCSRIIATCGDNRMVYVWDVLNRSLIGFTNSSDKLTNSAGRCLAFDKTNMC